mmetsp:Transcript_16508/g.33982  ORF Transcript_16508/g.33982 Transcript_16508/m.33982 type:complete len:180 (-) Transcript_16508:2054-2593(-)
MSQSVAAKRDACKSRSFDATKNKKSSKPSYNKAEDLGLILKLPPSDAGDDINNINLTSWSSSSERETHAYHFQCRPLREKMDVDKKRTKSPSIIDADIDDVPIFSPLRVVDQKRTKLPSLIDIDVDDAITFSPLKKRKLFFEFNIAADGESGNSISSNSNSSDDASDDDFSIGIYLPEC